MNQFQMPPVMKNASGEMRKVGFEMEFSGLEFNQITGAIQKHFGGDVRESGPYQVVVEKTRFGDFMVELDSKFLKEGRYQQYLRDLQIDPASSSLGRKIEHLVDGVVKELVPFEVVAPPIALQDIHHLEELRETLHRSGASGTHVHFYSAYGMQFNPEVPAIEAPIILNYLRAFFLLYDELFERAGIDLTRQVLPYIRPFDSAYIGLILNPGYRPNLYEFMQDYVDYNPTRNRPLDLMPLFCHIDREWLFNHELEDAELIKPRPTFHYRLPNCEIDDPRWSFAREWNSWVLIEKLAQDTKALEELGREYITLHMKKFFVRKEWIERMRRWVAANGQ